MSTIHKSIEQNKKPRIHISYDIETESGSVKKELPFVVGVMGDFSGETSSLEKKPIGDRKFIHINKDNFDDVMKKIQPEINIKVDNTIEKDKDSQLSVNCAFKSLDDFRPENLINQIPALYSLKATRDTLRDLLTQADRSAPLEILLEQVLKDNTVLQSIAKELKLDPTTEGEKQCR